MAKERKSSGVAVILSFLVPGLGQIYCGKFGKGLFTIFLAIGMIFFMSLITPLFLLFYLLLWVDSMYDAYKTAEKTWKRRRR